MKNLERVIELKKELDALRPLEKEREERIMQKFRLDWNYHSNHLEGNSLTFGETKALILHGITAQGKPLKDHFEITGHNDALEWVLSMVKQEEPLSEKFVKELHTLVLGKSYYNDAITPDGKPTRKKVNVGQYKTTSNHVRTKTGELFYFAFPEETPAKMTDLVDWYRREKNREEPILLAVLFHYKFIRIHPFDDGNGRTVRILMNFILMQNGYPPVIIKTEDKENYLSALQQADADTEGINVFGEYIIKNLCHSLEIMIKGAKGESIEEPDDLDKEILMLKKEVQNFKKFTKNITTVTDFYENSMEPLYRKFYSECAKMDSFYKDKRVYIGTLYEDTKGKKLDMYLDKIPKNTEYDPFLGIDNSSNVLIRNIVDNKVIELSFIQVYRNFRDIQTQLDMVSFIKISFGRDIIKISHNMFKVNFEREEIEEIKTYLNEIEDDTPYKKIDYGQNLTDEEINNLVSTVVKKHVDCIRQELKRSKNIE